MRMHVQDRTHARRRFRVLVVLLATCVGALILSAPVFATASGDGTADGDMVQIAGGDYHTVAVRQDGTVWAWGSDLSGGLGNGAPNTNSAIPVQVSGLTGVRQVAAGQYHSLAVKSDGTVWAWGSDSAGQLGNDASFVSQSAPVQVAGL